MSKKDENKRKNKEGVPQTERATIVPHAAPVIAKRSKMSAGAKIAVIFLFAIAIVAIALMVVVILTNNFIAKINSTTPWEEEEIKVVDRISDMNVYEDERVLSSDAYQAAVNEILLNYVESSHDLADNENIHNFAIYGINTFDNESSGKATLIAVTSFNNTTKEVKYLTFEEEVLVYIPVVGKIGFLRDAYEWGGSALLSKTIQHNFGIKIDGYVEINLTGAAKLIDNAGGMSVSATDAAPINEAIKAYNELFNRQVADVTVSGGKVSMNGEQALAYFRMGSTEMGVVLRTLTSAIFTSGLGGMFDAFDIIAENAKTSITKDDFLTVAKMAIVTLKKSDVTSVHLGTVETIWHFEFKVSTYTDYAGISAKLNEELN